MGLLDKVKEVAAQGAEAAKKGAAVAKDKVEDVQNRKKADELAKQLGYLVVKERTGGPAAGEEADRIVAEITELEKALAEDSSQGEAGAEG